MSTSSATAASPRLYGARARAGMQALADRVVANHLPARVFGHPVASPPDRDALVAALFSAAVCGVGWIFPGIALFAGATGVLACAIIGFLWFTPWPRCGGWTVVVGKPSAGIQRLSVLALDVREPRRYLTAVAGFAAGLSAAAPAWPGPIGIALLVAVVAAVDRVRAREIPIERAEAWVMAHAPGADALVLVSTAGSGHGEGVRAIVDWYALDGRNLLLEIDEEHVGSTLRRLNAVGIGRAAPHGGADVVVGDSARG